MSEPLAIVPLLTVEEAATILKRPIEWFYKNKRLPKRYVGRQLRFHPQELLDFTTKPQTTYPDMAKARQTKKVPNRKPLYIRQSE